MAPRWKVSDSPACVDYLKSLTEGSQRLDLVGVVILAGVLICFNFALTQAPISGWSSPSFIVPFVLAFVLFPSFFFWGRSCLLMYARNRGLMSSSRQSRAFPHIPPSFPERSGRPQTQRFPPSRCLPLSPSGPSLSCSIRHIFKRFSTGNLVRPLPIPMLIYTDPSSVAVHVAAAILPQGSIAFVVGGAAQAFPPSWSLSLVCRFCVIFAEGLQLQSLPMLDGLQELPPFVST